MCCAKTGYKDIVFYGSKHGFKNIPRACLSLTTREHVGMRFEPQWSLPEPISVKEERGRKQGTKTGNDDREPRRGTKTGNQERETKTGNQER